MKTLVSGLFLAALLSLSSTSSIAQTPDGETPAEEAVCDVLADATPGLFGLCTAYCEAQDCDSYADGEQPASCDALLRNYNRLANEEDPGMPCASACPCWDADTLAAGGTLPDGMTQLPTLVCFEDDETDNFATFDTAVYGFIPADLIAFTAGDNLSIDGVVTRGCIYFNAFDPTLTIGVPTSPGQDQKCRMDVQALHLEDFAPIGLPCPNTW